MAARSYIRDGTARSSIVRQSHVMGCPRLSREGSMTFQCAIIPRTALAAIENRPDRVPPPTPAQGLPFRNDPMPAAEPRAFPREADILRLAAPRLPLPPLFPPRPRDLGQRPSDFIQLCRGDDGVSQLTARLTRVSWRQAGRSVACV